MNLETLRGDGHIHRTFDPESWGPRADYGRPEKPQHNKPVTRERKTARVIVARTLPLRGTLRVRRA